MKTWVRLGTVAAMLLAAARGAEVTLTRMPDRVRVEIAGHLFTEYVYAGASRP